MTGRDADAFHAIHKGITLLSVGARAESQRLALSNQASMIGKSIQDYIQIRAAILGFRVVAPISLIYLAASVAQGKLFGSTWLALYAMVEAAFYLVVYVPRQRRMQKVNSQTLSLLYRIYLTSSRQRYTHLS